MKVCLATRSRKDMSNCWSVKTLPSMRNSALYCHGAGVAENPEKPPVNGRKPPYCAAFGPVGQIAATTLIV